jgi:hypothetical protein
LELEPQPEDEHLPPAKAEPRMTAVWIMAASVAVAAVAAVAWLRAGLTAPARVSLVLSIVPPQGIELVPVGAQSSAPEISPDGSTVLFAASDGLYIRRLNSLSATLVPGSENYINVPFWSADSTTVVFATVSRELVKVRLPDGAPETVTRLPGPTRGGTWSENGTLLIAAAGVLFTVPSSGGELKQVPMPAGEVRAAVFPQFLPGGTDFVFHRVSATGEREMHLATLSEGALKEMSRLIAVDTAARYTPAQGGRLLFVRNDNLYAQRLNRAARRLEGDAELIAQGVASNPEERADFSVASNGVLAWRGGRAAVTQVTMFDRSGRVAGTAGPAGRILGLLLSPDETQLLARTGDQDWLIDVGEPGRQLLPRGIGWFGWSPDGASVRGMRGNRSFVERSNDASAEVREIGSFVDEKLRFPSDISPDGRHVLFVRAGGGGVFSGQPSGTPDERRLRTLVPPDEGAFDAHFSPNGRWIVYSVGGELYVQPFPGPGRRRPIASRAQDPEWRRDGREIVYLDPAGAVWSVAVQSVGDALGFSTPTQLFTGLQIRPGSIALDRLLAVSRDGSRLFFPQAVEQPAGKVIHIDTARLSN